MKEGYEDFSDWVSLLIDKMLNEKLYI